MDKVKFNIACDSSCDYDKFVLDKRGIDVIEFEYICDGVSYIDDMAPDKTEFYNLLENSNNIHTSQINVNRYIEFFKNIYKGLPILFISLASALSNTYNNACMARDELKKEGIEIKVLDSKIASSGIALLIDKAYRKQKKGYDIEKAYNCLVNTTTFINTFYFTNTLSYFYKGGRLSKAEFLLGSLLNINVILDCTKEGKLRCISKDYGRNKAFKDIENRIKESVVNPSEQVLYVTHSESKEEAIILATKLVNEFGFIGYQISEFGPIVGSHTGTGLISFFFEGKARN